MSTALLQEVLKRLKKKKIDYIAAWVRGKNLTVQKFLRQHKFTKGYSFIWMEKTDKPLWPEHKKDRILYTDFSFYLLYVKI